MKRNIYNNPSGKPYCCHADCNKDATKEIRYSNDLEDYTHSCNEHLAEMKAGSEDIGDLDGGGANSRSEHNKETVMKTAREIWTSRNPSHDLDDQGVDRFYKTMEMCMHEYAKQALNASKERLLKSQLNNDFDVMAAYDEIIIELP